MLGLNARLKESKSLPAILGGKMDLCGDLMTFRTDGVSLRSHLFLS